MIKSGVQSKVLGGGLMGLFGGAVLCAFATAVLMLKGFPDEIPVLKVYGIYLGGGFVAGLIVGVLAPWIRSRAAATIVSVVAVMPITGAFLILISGPIQSWGEAELITLVFCSLFFSIFVGRIVWEQINFSTTAHYR